MSKGWNIVKWVLIAWGAISFAVSVAVLYSIGPGNRDRFDRATKQDVRFVLNWCRLGDERIERVVHSYESARSFTGDHLDAYAIKISHVDPAELTPDKDGSGWVRCDQLEGVLKAAVDFSIGWFHREEISWFLEEHELGSAEVFVYPWSIYCQGTRPYAVSLIFVRPKDRMVYFISAKT